LDGLNPRAKPSILGGGSRNQLPGDSGEGWKWHGHIGRVGVVAQGRFQTGIHTSVGQRPGRHTRVGQRPGGHTRVGQRPEGHTRVEQRPEGHTRVGQRPEGMAYRSREAWGRPDLIQKEKEKSEQKKWPSTSPTPVVKGSCLTEVVTPDADRVSVQPKLSKTSRGGGGMKPWNH